MDRTLILTVALLVAGTASAREQKTVAEVCRAMPYAQEVACFQAVANRPVDGGAAAVCAAMPYSQEVECMATIAGKRFAEDELAACEAMPYSQEVGCLRAIGHPISTGYTINLPGAGEIARSLQCALGKLEQGDVDGAADDLTTLLRRLRPRYDF